MAGRKIIILHGWTYSKAKWRDISDFLKAHRIKFEMPDIPGLTDGTSPVWDLDNYVAWLEKYIGSQKDVILIGHSNGGRIAMAYAMKHSDQLHKLIIIDGAGLKEKRLGKIIKRDALKFSSKLVKKSATLTKLSHKFNRFTQSADYRRADDNMKQTMAKLLAVDLTDDLHKITAETIIIWGELDQLTPLKDGQIINQAIKGSKLFVINGARHAPQTSHYREVGKILVKELS